MELAIKLFLVINVMFLLNTLAECQECKADNLKDWSYHGKKNGPDKWRDFYCVCKEGRKQSPINIDQNTTTVDASLKDMKYKYYDHPVRSAKIFNTGETVELIPTDKVRRTIEIENVIYTLESIQLHWGSTGRMGSDHTLNNQGYSLEVQLLHYDVDDNIAIVSVLFQTFKEEIHYNRHVNPILHRLRTIPYKGDKTYMLDYLDLSKVMPKTLSKFYRYTGSRTSPPCAEGVIWTVMQDTKKIGWGQLDKLYGLHSTYRKQASDTCHIVNNFRPVQPLNDRTIYATE